MSRIETTATTTAVVVLTALLLIWAATSWPWIFLAFVTISGVTVLVLAFVSQLIGMKLPMDAIGPEIEQLMRYGYHGSKRFRDLNSKRGVEFVKRVPAESPTRFFMRIHRKHCSPSEFRRAVDVLKRLGMKVEFQDDGKGSTKAIFVECGQDLEKAVAAAKAVLTGAFGVPPESLVRGTAAGAIESKRNKMIGWDRDIDRLEARRKDEARAAPVGARGRIVFPGLAEFEGTTVHVLAESGFLDPGAVVEVIRVTQGRIVVRGVSNSGVAGVEQ